MPVIGSESSAVVLTAEDMAPRLGRLLDQSSFEIYVFDARTLRFIHVNDGARRNLGYGMEELSAFTPLDLNPDFDQTGFARLVEPLRDGTQREIVFETRHRRKDGSSYPVEVRLQLSSAEEPPLFVAFILDIGERKRTEERLNYLTFHDHVTGLANRTLLLQRLSRVFAAADRHERLAALLVLDLDRFKQINDSLGHEAGDRLLCRVAERLLLSVRPGDTVARVGGDEFIVVLADIAQLADIAHIVRKILSEFAAPFEVAGQNLFVAASAGVTVYPNDGRDVELLFKNAGVALRHAKATGRNVFQFFTAEMNAHVERQLALDMAMRQALERDEFHLVYQPQTDLATGGIVGVEALIRWRYGDETVSPAEFIPLAEDSGFIVPIGAWVLRTACAQAVAWRNAGLPTVRMSVNLSVRQFREDDLAEMIESILADTGLEPSSLELEITETAIMHQPDSVREKLARLDALGVNIAVDDFGTGYSSLGYLKCFHIDSLKIDRSFVQDVIRDPGDAAIAQAIIGLSHSLGIKVVAEGVETQAQLAFLQRRGCDVIQGYYFSRPIAPDEVARMLREDRRLEGYERSESGPERTLLIVDDEPNIRQALARTLRRENYRILLAAGPSEAFEILAREPVGVILSDQRMPDMTGVEFLHRVKHLYPRTVRLVLSGYTELESVTDAINRGAIYRFLTKPWEDDLLREHLREAFRHYALGDGDEPAGEH